MNLIEVSNLSKIFADNIALDNININIKAGEMTGLVGPDGSGKTTLLRIIAGIMNPSQGEVKRDINLRPEMIGYMPQKFGLYEDLSVIENMNLYADLKGLDITQKEEIFDRLLNFTDLKPFTKRLAGNLSGGMKQKLGLSCALMTSPKLLILDEPSVGVDPISRKDLWQMVKELTNEETAIIWATSYLDEASRFPSIILLNEGKLIYTGETKNFTAKISNFIISNIENPREFLLQIIKDPNIIDATLIAGSIKISSSKDISNIKLLKNLDIKKIDSNFEDIFIARLGGIKERRSIIASKIENIGSKQDIVIEAANLTKEYAGFKAANNVSFQIRRGEIFGLLGPNGAGKSTTFKMLCGLTLPSEGKASILNMDLNTSKARQSIGYMAQKFSLYGNLSVVQNLSFFAGIYGLTGQVKKEAIEEMLNIFDLTRLRELTTDSLSLGFKQRLSLACSLMHKPSVLFLDEPTSGIDPITRREFWMHINALVQKNVTIMVTTHFMDEAEYCDRIAFIFQGKKIAEGSPQDLKAQIQNKDFPDPTLEDVFGELIRKHNNA